MNPDTLKQAITMRRIDKPLTPAQVAHMDRVFAKAAASSQFRDAFDDLRIAARQVIASWERGDLAMAVRNLDAALQRINNLPR